ncbi:Gfo/Idh/MocA family protein [Candidatus Methylopumilus planktonicus]|uniref:Gfo/Idh/MocA family protein n=1 Tax=Candidatus Methylopumilus planktonicus TaxID=1581557 RepID=UPI003D18E4C4
MNRKVKEIELLRVLIVGCGNIAGGFDKGRNLKEYSYTHAGAYSQHGRFKLVACVEPNNTQRLKFMEDWNIPIGFCSIDEVFNLDEHFDVISICSPTICHSNDIKAAIKLRPKLIFCEKPISPSLSITQELVEELISNNIMMAVNYSRRWDPDIQDLKNKILSGELGELRSIIGIYNKGILNNGSHILDLLNFLVGPIKAVRAGKANIDYSPNDPTVPVWLENSWGLQIQLACGHASDYAIFELQFIFSSGILAMEDGGLNWRERLPIDSVIFKGYRNLGEGVRKEGQYSQSMRAAVNNIYQAIVYKEPLLSSAESALLAQIICEEVKQKTYF